MRPGRSRTPSDTRVRRSSRWSLRGRRSNGRRRRPPSSRTPDRRPARGLRSSAEIGWADASIVNELGEDRHGDAGVVGRSQIDADGCPTRRQVLVGRVHSRAATTSPSSPASPMRRARSTGHRSTSAASRACSSKWPWVATITWVEASTPACRVSSVDAARHPMRPDEIDQRRGHRVTIRRCAPSVRQHRFHVDLHRTLARTGHRHVHDVRPVIVLAEHDQSCPSGFERLERGLDERRL